MIRRVLIALLADLGRVAFRWLGLDLLQSVLQREAARQAHDAAVDAAHW